MTGHTSRERLSGLCSLAWGKIEHYRPAILNELAAAIDRAMHEDDPDPQRVLAWKRLLGRARDAGLDWEPHYEELAGRMEYFQKHKESMIRSLGSCPGDAQPQGTTRPDCFLIPKEGLDSDFRSLVGGKASHSGEIMLALREIGDEEIRAPLGFASTTLLWSTVRDDARILEGPLQVEMTRMLLPCLAAHQGHYRRLLADRRIEGPTAQPPWAALAGVIADAQPPTPEALQTCLDAFCAWLPGLDEVQNDAVLLAYARVFGRFAVRSSGVREDSLEESFAGQKLTILNVLGPVELCRAIGQVLASGAEATLVEEMIPSEVSGVAFSVHPGTGNFGQIMVNSAYGLGEGVVSGRVDPDTMGLDKRTGRLLGQPILGRKLTRIVPASHGPSGAGTTREETVPFEMQRQICLRDRQQVLLATAVRTLEGHFDYPLDMEWAVDPVGRLFVLQSRPITTLWRTLARGKALMAVESCEASVEDGLSP